jgi:hypothetical protein
LIARAQPRLALGDDGFVKKKTLSHLHKRRHLRFGVANWVHVLLEAVCADEAIYMLVIAQPHP